MIDVKVKEITQEEYNAIEKAEKQTKSKRLSRKLKVLLYRYKGSSPEETSKQVGLSKSQVNRLVSEYEKTGLKEYIREKQIGNHRCLSKEEEQAILDEFEQKACAGQIVTVQEIKRAFDKRLGRDTGSNYIYTLLKRHNWRKVMPRARHPKKADEETVDASKKLTIP